MRHTVSILLPTFLFLLPTCALAKVTGPCVDCHTMHNSQDNQPMTLLGGQANPALLTADCVGCHTGQNTSVSDTPFVFNTSPPQYRQTGTEADSNTLAGGNFYWVGNIGGDIGDRLGHNVKGISSPDGKLSLPPGGDGTFSGQLTCAGTNGCHGLRATAEQVTDIKGGHHGKDHSIWQDGSTLAKSYRLLNTIQGLGDSAYEFTPSSTQHNKYFGQDRGNGNEADPGGTISSFCAGCHEDFHNGAGSIGSGTGVWLRHPTDYDMSGAGSLSGEYTYYNGGTGSQNPYSVISPLATADTSTSVKEIVYDQPDDAIVMCLSCHRAHGTPNPAILRWDYKGWPAGGYNGCQVCHTAKN